MKISARLAGPVAAILSGAALIASPMAHADADAAFLQALSQHGITWSSNDDVIKLGHLVCSDWADGFTFQQVFNDAKNLNLNDHDTAVFVGAATGAYCPSYLNKVQ